MSVAALTWAFQRPMTDHTAKAVLVALADHADEEGRCYPSVKRLELYTALSDRAIHAAISRLESAGALKVIRRPGRFSIYQINAAWSGETSEPASPPKQLRRRTSSTTPEPASPPPANAVRTNHHGTVKEPAVVASARAMDAMREVWPDLDRANELPGLTASLGMVESWIGDGAQLDRDILPTIRRLSEARKATGPPRSFKYFAQAVADAKATNESPLPHGQPAPERSARQPAYRNGFAGMAAAGLYGAGNHAGPEMDVSPPDPDYPAHARAGRRLVSRS